MIDVNAKIISNENILVKGRKEAAELYCSCESLAFIFKYCVSFDRHRDSLLVELGTYKPCVDFVSEIRILLLGPIGSGKSSFINSVKSVFQGRLTRQARVGSDVTSITEQVSDLRIF